MTNTKRILKKFFPIVIILLFIAGFSYSQSFTEQTSISLTGVYLSSVDWGDYNNDGDLDILLTGSDGTNLVSKIYKNNGDGNFTEQTSISLTGVYYYSSVSWSDYDNDGDLDILLTGSDGNNLVSKIYKNNGDGNFTEQTSISLTGVYDSSVSWGDYDNDGDLDILLTGYDGSNPVSKIYKNNGDGSFTEQTSISLTGVEFGSAAWGDYDNDGGLDILLTGLDSNSNPVSKIYKNGGNGNFTEQASISLTGVIWSSVVWGDYDNDGDLDILLTGLAYDSNYNSVSKIYKNNGDGSFTEQTSISLTGVYDSSIAWGDYDNDGDLDILLTGNSNSNPVSKIYKNNNPAPNTLPAAPTNLISIVDGSSVAFSWNKSTDNETPQNGLKYNLVIGTTSGSVNTLSPMADRLTGYRRIVKRGNVQTNSWTIKDLPDGTYYWSVQAIDAAFAGSEFAEEQSFTIEGAVTVEEMKAEMLPKEFVLYQNYPNPFNPNTVIRFSLPERGNVSVTVYNVLGEVVERPIQNKIYQAGNYETAFEGKHLTSGAYIYEIRVNGNDSGENFSTARKMLYVK